MTTSIDEGIRLANGGEAVKFSMTIDGQHRFCLVSREVINDLSASNARGDALLAEFRTHADLIDKTTERAILGGLIGDPLIIPAAMFFPLGRPPR